MKRVIEIVWMYIRRIYKIIFVIVILCAVVSLNADLTKMVADSSQMITNAEESRVTLPISNGYSGAEYNIKNRSFTKFHPHLYARYSRNRKNKQLIAALTPVITFKKENIDLTHLNTSSCGYLTGTGIIEHVMSGSNFMLTQYGFCPFFKDGPFWVVLLVLESEEINNFALNVKTTKKSIQANIGKWASQDENKKWLYVIISHNKTIDERNHQDVVSFRNQWPDFQALLQEIKWWKTWHRQTIKPAIFERLKNKYYYQSLALIKMAQCREEGTPEGQIFSSLRPGSSWTYTLDQSYATEALISAGHFLEARQSLQFLLDNQGGRYKQLSLFDNNYGIGEDYILSVSKYYGNGNEISDSTENGPNIELAGFGLVLNNIGNYVKESDDYKFLEYYWDKIRYQIADVLIHSIDKTGLIRKESGPWRVHLPGKHFTYTSICAYRGLLSANWMATKMDDENFARECESAAQKIRKNLEQKLYLTDDNVLKGNLEGRIPEHYVDGSVVEAINYLSSPQDNISHAAINTINKYLQFNSNPPLYANLLNGNKRFEDNLFVNMRLAIGLKKLRKHQKAEKIMNKIIKRSEKYGLALPRYYIDHMPAGESPMIGKGAANIILYYNE
ncbi:MAG: hypothetical protein K9M80_01380 [Candidatus Marinimicrobia bacterium]|nr:hypothetical protein [Candidatus Neomarinimicrobiota bacterium]